jgi:hypothetical protein
MPMPTAAKPTMAPTMEWVVETGQPLKEASVSQTAAARSAAIIPKIRISGRSAIAAGSMIPLRIVLVT